MESNSAQFLRMLAQTSDVPLLLEIERAERCRLYGPNGKSWLDLISGISVSNVGHAAPEVISAIKNQADLYLHTMVYGEYVQSPQVRYAENLIRSLGKGLDTVYFVTSGSEAVEGALKIAKKFTGRSGIIAFHNSYHGSTHGALSVTGTEWLKQGFGPLLPGIKHLDFGNVNQLDEISDSTACVIVEPVQAEAGVILPPAGFLEALRKRCTETGTILIFDEIQTGMGRTGSMFAFQKYGVFPDIILLAKSLGGGMPLGAFITRREIMSVITQTPLGHITTFGGHPVSCAAGLAAFEKIQSENLAENASKMESFIFSEMIHPAIRNVRGTGMLFAIELEHAEKVRNVVAQCIENGVVLDWFLNAENCLRLAPPLVISESELQEGITVILKALDN